MLHQPVPERSRTRAVVVCPPFGDERKSAWRVLADMSRALARNGYPVLRFDYHGCGESPGAFVDATVASRIADIASAGECVFSETGAEVLTVVGLRFGATLALEAEPRLPGADAAILIEPIVDGEKYFERMVQRKKLRRMMTGSGDAEGEDARDILDLDGYPVRRETLDALQNLNLHLPDRADLKRISLIQVSFNQQLRQDTETALAELRGSGVDTTLRTIVMKPFWSRVDIVDSAELEQAVVSEIEGPS
ncbi:MAG: alpha/beta fold hydrolase [Candidatus Brocadiia bacterium]